MVFAGAEWLLESAFIGYQGVSGCCGSEMKGYLFGNKINGLRWFLATFDDK
jgi:hypothetical protein